jgi:hypothetical protein
MKRKEMETGVLVRGKGDGSLGFRERKEMEWDHSGKGKGKETWALVRGKGMDLLV